MNSADTRPVSSCARFVCSRGVVSAGCVCMNMRIHVDNVRIHSNTRQGDSSHPTHLDVLGPEQINKILEPRVLLRQPQQRVRLCRRGGHGAGGHHRLRLFPPVVVALAATAAAPACRGHGKMRSAAAAAVAALGALRDVRVGRCMPLRHAQHRVARLLERLARRLFCC